MAFLHSRWLRIALLAHTSPRSTKWLSFGLLTLSLVTGTAQAQIPLNTIVQVAAGQDFSCALTADGAVSCWGDNYYGQLGDGSYSNHSVARPVAGLGSQVTRITTGNNHACALLANGVVKCWGSNILGALGYSGDSSPTPVTVAALGESALAITSGAHHNCAILSGGNVRCWGSNTRGELGLGVVGNQEDGSAYSGNVIGISDAIAVSAGIFHSCALLGSGAVKCWGDNSYNQMGNNYAANDHTAQDIPGLATGVSRIAVGGIAACALLQSGSVNCWGSGQGSGLTEISDFSEAISDITRGYSHSCAVSVSGALSCWGSNNDGQLGNGSTDYSGTPIPVAGLPGGASYPSAGHDHTCALVAGGVKCWGKNINGELGDSSLVTSLTPVTSLQAFAPYIGVATAGNSQAIVRFTPPTDDSGSPITGYTVTSIPAGGIDLYAGSTASHTGPNDLSHLVTGLTNGVSYKFTVTATNALGTGLPSGQSNAVVPTGPSSSSSSSSSAPASSSSSSIVATSSSSVATSASSIATSSSHPATSSSSSVVSSSSITSSAVSSSSRSSSSSSVNSSSSSAAAQTASCTYVVASEWNKGFTATIRIKNTGTTTINGWSVNWQYKDGSLVTSGWNSVMTGSNPYTASNLSWNASIAPGQTVEFGVQGSKPSKVSASTPVVTGALCK